MEAFFAGLIRILSDYLVFLYPGFITLTVYAHVNAEENEDNKEFIIKCVAISFFYHKMLLPAMSFVVKIAWKKCLNTSLKFNVVERHVALFILAAIFPYVFWKLQSIEALNKMTRKLGIFTSRYENPLDIAMSKEKHVWVSLYMDELGLKYEGSLRHYVRDLSKAKYITISNYKIYKIHNHRIKKKDKSFKVTYFSIIFLILFEVL